MAENNDLFQFDNFSGVEDRTPEADIQTEEITASISENDAVDNEEPHNTDAGSYNDDAIQHLDWNEHIRRRPGMYIGKLGDGSHAEDGIYVLIKEVVDNSIDEFNMVPENV